MPDAFLSTVGALALAGVAFLVLLAAAEGVRTRSWARSRAALLAAAPGLITYTVVTAILIAVVAGFRRDPPFVGTYQDPRETYQAFATLAAVLTYIAATSVAVLIARPQPPKGISPLLTIGAVLTFVLITVPVVEMLQACYAGVSVLLRPAC